MKTFSKMKNRNSQKCRLLTLTHKQQDTIKQYNNNNIIQISVLHNIVLHKTIFLNLVFWFRFHQPDTTVYDLDDFLNAFRSRVFTLDLAGVQDDI